MKAIWHWIVSAMALGVVAWLFQGIWVDSVFSLLLAALVLGFINMVIRPVLQLLALPVTIVTLGIFALVINAILLGVTGALVPGFHVHGFFAAFWGSIVLSIVSSVMHKILEEES